MTCFLPVVESSSEERILIRRTVASAELVGLDPGGRRFAVGQLDLDDVVGDVKLAANLQAIVAVQEDGGTGGYPIVTLQAAIDPLGRLRDDLATLPFHPARPGPVAVPLGEGLGRPDQECKMHS